VWNAPTSCAWAARVYVSNGEARDHGVAHVGLPSRLAAFDCSSASSSSSGSTGGSWWRPRQQQLTGASTSSSTSSSALDVVEVRNLERGRRGLPRRPVAALQLPSGVRTSGFLGPRLRLSLPSFSGGTPEHPALLEYACDLRTRVMPVAPARVLSLASEGNGNDCAGEVVDAVLRTTPLLALAFSDMVMSVAEPSVLALPSPAGAAAAASSRARLA
jgi:hypothetical protein